MKDLWLIMGFGAGLVAGALLYKHCDDAKKLVNKGEKAVKQEVDSLKQTVKQQKPKGSKKPAEKKQ